MDSQIVFSKSPVIFLEPLPLFSSFTRFSPGKRERKTVVKHMPSYLDSQTPMIPE